MEFSVLWAKYKSTSGKVLKSSRQRNGTSLRKKSLFSADGNGSKPDTRFARKSGRKKPFKQPIVPITGKSG